MPKYRRDDLQNIQQEYLAGRERLEAGALDDAIAHFDSILGRLPRRRRDRVYRIENPVTSLRSEGVHWLPTIFRDALMAKVYCLNELGRFDDASVLLARAVEIDPENPQVYVEIGFTHGAQANYELARTAYLHARDLEPTNPVHLRALAHIALLGEHFEEAHQWAQKALTLESTSVPALHQLAYAKYRLGNIDGAIRALLFAVELDASDRESVLRLVGTLREAGRFREAIEKLEAFLQLEDTDPEALGLMTDLLQQDGTAPELFSHANRLLARNRRDPNGLDLLAWGYYQNGKTNEALKVLRRLVLLEPMQPHHHFKLGMIYESLGQLPQAMAALLRAALLDEGGDIGQMATEAVTNLDQVQLEQIMARVEVDLSFRSHLQQNPEQTVLQSGFLLSPSGFQMLQSFDISHGSFSGLDTRSRTIH